MFFRVKRRTAVSAILILILSSVAAYGQDLQTSFDSGGSLLGRIWDSGSGEAVAGANVYIPQLDIGTSTDFEGSFRLPVLPAGEYKLVISFLGYQSHQDTITDNKVKGSEFLEIGLTPTAILSEEVIVTATQKRQSIALAPASISVVTAEELQQRNTNTFDQAFDGVSGVQVTRSSEANVQTVSIRGASEVAGGGIGNRILLLIDGRPSLSPESGGALWNLVPVAAIDRIEVVKGAYSSLYGSSAMGGVINVLTKKPRFGESETTFDAHYGFYQKAPSYTEYDQFNDFNSITVSHSRGLEDFSYLINASRKANDGHREKSGYELYNFFGKGYWKINKKRSITFSANANLIDNHTPATWLSPSRPYNVAPHRMDDFQHRNEYNGDVLYTSIPNGRMKYSSRFYYYQNDSRFSFDDDPGNDSTNVNIGKQSVAKSSVRAQRWGNVNQYDLHFGNNHYVIIGSDVKFDHVLGKPDTVLYGLHKALQVGAYIQDEVNLSPRLIGTIGVRYDHYTILNEFSEGTVSPKLALVYSASPNLTLRTLFAQAFRNPSIAERFIKFEQGGGLKFMPNPDLKAERLDLSIELGMLKRIGKGWSVDAALYYNHYRNLISFEQVAQSSGALVYRVVNLNRAVMQGGEINVRYQQPDRFSGYISYNFLDARDRSEGRLNEALAYKSKHTLGFGGGLRYQQWRLNIDGKVRSRIEEVFIYPGSEPDGFFVWNGRLSYEFLADSDLYLAVSNIGNTQYEELERYRMAGRSYSFGVSLSL